MSNIFDRIIVGKVIQDLGTFYERTWSTGRERYGGLLVERRGRYWYVIKSSYLAFFAPTVNYQRVPLDGAEGLREQLQQAQDLSKSLPPAADDASSVALIVSLLTMAIAILVCLLLTDAGWVLLIALIALFIQLYQYAGYKAHFPANAAAETLLIAAPAITVLVAALRFIWLVAVLSIR